MRRTVCGAISPSAEPAAGGRVRQSPMRSYLDFEKSVAELEAKVDELRELAANLTPWQKTQVARHPERPHFVDYIAGCIEEFTPLAGDRKFGEDEAIVG